MSGWIVAFVTGLHWMCCRRYANGRGNLLYFLKVGEFFHQLFHAVAREHDGELGVFAIAFAHEDGAFTIFGVADTLAFFQIGGAGGVRDVDRWTGERAGLAMAGIAAEEAGDVVDGVGFSAAVTLWA